jgi:hypothetical protein
LWIANKKNQFYIPILELKNKKQNLFFPLFPIIQKPSDHDYFSSVITVVIR